MDRRSFLRTASAASILPLMPALPAAAPAAVAAAPAVNEFMYGMAVFNARLRGASSTAKIARDLGIAKDAAQALQARMVQDGVVSLPSATGVARVHNPIVRGSNSWKLRAEAKLKEKLRERLEEEAHALKDEMLEQEERPRGEA